MVNRIAFHHVAQPTTFGAARVSFDVDLHPCPLWQDQLLLDERSHRPLLSALTNMGEQTEAFVSAQLTDAARTRNLFSVLMQSCDRRPDSGYESDVTGFDSDYEFDYEGREEMWKDLTTLVRNLSYNNDVGPWIAQTQGECALLLSKFALLLTALLFESGCILHV